MNLANCDCIVDTVFTGKLQSDVVCQVGFFFLFCRLVLSNKFHFTCDGQNCKNVSTTIDPFWDISLDLPTVLPGTKLGSAAGGAVAAAAAAAMGQPISLQNCLERFTKPEHLGSTAKIKCSICKSYQVRTINSHASSPGF